MGSIFVIPSDGHLRILVRSRSWSRCRSRKGITLLLASCNDELLALADCRFAVIIFYFFKKIVSFSLGDGQQVFTNLYGLSTQLGYWTNTNEMMINDCFINNWFCIV